MRSNPHRDARSRRRDRMPATTCRGSFASPPIPACHSCPPPAQPGGHDPQQDSSTTTAAPAPDDSTSIVAGAGGTIAESDLPLAGVALAGGLVIVTGAAALKMRREQQA